MQTTLVFETSKPFKAEMVEALLKSADIPCEKKAFGIGPVMTKELGHGSKDGIQILVPEEFGGKAREILEGAGYIPAAD